MGRTGRVFAGINIRLYSNQFFDSGIEDFDLPAMRMSPLEKTFIQAKFLAERLPPLPVYDTKDLYKEHQKALKERREQERSRKFYRGGWATNDWDSWGDWDWKRNKKKIADKEGGQEDTTGGPELRKLKPSELLRKTPSPPEIGAIQDTLEALARMGAITRAEQEAQVTILGRLMIHLGIDEQLAQLVGMS